ncbi:hypothetical protein QKT26_gp73 [Carcinus maenas nudivirus]|uniref:Uncharacterized protein n=1 Tax=Carcinus maenas nudivirus TaxID=2880837 RepID=A0AAE9BZE3_9VIRU|nr:hypothetical protein QKT26_gp73 [Carcinus maenas nudivirus]UBZ25663.1 hypothetical protein CmNV_072 [Carcinus maenas nudivirus]
MFIDHLSYNLAARKQKKSYNFSKLKNGRYYVVLYKCDHISYHATHYEFEVIDKQYIIHKKEFYTNMKSTRYTKVMGLKTYLTKFMDSKYVFLIQNLIEHPEYPFEFIDKKNKIMKKTRRDMGIDLYAHTLKTYMYSIPVKDFCEYNSKNDELDDILSYYGYKKITTKDIKQKPNDDIDDIVKYIMG